MGVVFKQKTAYEMRISDWSSDVCSSDLGVILPISPITEKDRIDLAFALDLGADWIALSFIQRPEDLIEARGLVGDRAAIMTKIEKPAALDCLPQLIALSDAVMVARGDLGVEMPPETIPSRQLGRAHVCTPVTNAH